MSKKLKNTDFAAAFENAAHTEPATPGDTPQTKFSTHTPQLAERYCYALLDEFAQQFENLIDVCNLRGFANYSDYANYCNELKCSIKNVMDDYSIAHSVSNNQNK